MHDPLKTEMVLAGTYAGKNVKINGHEFVNGVCVLHGKLDTLEGAVKYLATYQAYPKGSEDLEAAQARDSGKEVQHGERNVEKDLEQGQAEEVHGDVQSAGEQPAEEKPDDSPVNAEAPQGDAGSGPSGDGHEDAGIPDKSEEAAGEERSEGSERVVNEDPERVVNEALRGVVMALDSSNDGHWTAEGLPALAAVEESYGSAGLTRDDVEAVEPGWNREKAGELKDLNG